jgi:hypothetical protein
LQIREADQLFFLVKRQFVVVAAALVSACALTACMSNDISANTPSPAGMTNSGSYPLVGETKQAATTQMSDQEAAALGAKLQALADARKAGTVSEAEYNRKVAEMQKLGAETQAAAKAGAPASN